MIEWLNNIDTTLFLWLNGINSPAFDKIMWFISGKKEWIPFYIILIGYIIYKFRMRSILLIVLVALLITLSDQSSVKLFKNVFERLRPCHNPDIQHLVHIVNNKCGGKFGFVSSHAANSFALAMYISLAFKQRYMCFIMFFWATLVSYSRIYLGVHYPGDILGGAILGMLIGYLTYEIFKWSNAKIFKPAKNN